jgi:hypothetical protein
MKNGHSYKSKEFNKFIEDMEQAGFEVQHYNGRFFWSGPAVACDNLQDVLSNTKIKCQWDSLGLGYIVYPMAREVV